VVARAVLAALRRRPRPLVWLALWSLPEALPAVLSGFAIARAVDTGFLAGRPAIGLAWLGLLALAVPIGAYATRRAYRCLADLVEPFRDDLVRLVAAGALRRGANGSGPPDRSALSRLTHQVEIVRDTFAGLVMTVRGFVFALVGAVLGLLSLAPVLALVVLPPVLLGLAGFLALVPLLGARQRDYILADERLADSAGQAVRGLRDVAACGAEDQVAATVGACVDRQARAERGIARMAGVRSVSLAIGGWLPLILLLFGAPLLLHKGISVGAILGALTYLLHGLQPALYTLVRGLGGGGLRLAVTLDRLLRADAPPVPVRPAPVRPAGGALVLRGVTFRYGRYAEPVVADLDLTLEPDDHLAIVGPSGIGKSTLAGLLAGVLRPQAGEVRLGGVPVARLDPATLARHRVLIPQEAYVLTGTLWANLIYLRPGVRLREVDAAVDALGLGPLVRRLGGYAATLNPLALAAGERQLIALARAYLSPAPLALLDEATCHLDPAAEARVEHAFAARPGALVVIAHRISSALRARRILVLDGTSARLGSHDELMVDSPLYRELLGHWRVAPDSGAAPDPGTAPDSYSQPDSSATRTASSRLRAPVLRMIVDT
jgi:ATP-binding cassette subfamily C protein